MKGFWIVLMLFLTACVPSNGIPPVLRTEIAATITAEAKITPSPTVPPTPLPTPEISVGIIEQSRLVWTSETEVAIDELPFRAICTWREGGFEAVKTLSDVAIHLYQGEIVAVGVPNGELLCAP